ncbi:MAG: thiamine phosphate synthase [Planctomycetes bacterium]|nr:thiamine phosphate synthase [Planctomycetota bacterium]
MVTLPPRVLPITPGRAHELGAEDLRRDLQCLREAGCDGVLIREPGLPDRELYELARYARDLFGDGWLGVHDRAHVALAVTADAVHLGFQSIAPLAARRILGPSVAIGHSQHAPELTCESMDADYRFMGPVFATASKEGILEPLGEEAFLSSSFLERTWAVGGIDASAVARLLPAGVGGVACIGSVFTSNPGKSFLALLEASKS